MNGVCIDHLKIQLWTVYVLTTWGVGKERCLHRQLEESAMNDAYTVCIDNLRSQLWSVFVLTTWGVNYERCFYWQLEESAMNGVCMDNLIVIANTDWLIDWWFLSAQVQIFHAYSGREKVQQYLKYTLKWVRDLQPGQPFVTVIGNAWWVGCGHKVKPFFSTTMRCHFLRNQRKRCSTCREYNILTLVHGRPVVL
jgi:hypothetical protein